jgi:hypothetical protein
MINLTKLTNRKMENQKKLTDAEIQNVINAVKLTKWFATKCKYKSAMSIYNILEGNWNIG